MIGVMAAAADVFNSVLTLFKTKYIIKENDSIVLLLGHFFVIGLV